MKVTSCTANSFLLWCRRFACTVQPRRLHHKAGSMRRWFDEREGRPHRGSVVAGIDLEVSPQLSQAFAHDHDPDTDRNVAGTGRPRGHRDTLASVLDF